MYRKVVLFAVVLALVLSLSSLATADNTVTSIDSDSQEGSVYVEVGDGLFIVNDGSYQSIFLVTGEGVIVVDAPPSSTQLILDSIAEVTDEPITHVVYSHSHADHISGAGQLPADATYIAHEDTLQQLERTLGEGSTYGVFVGGGQVPLPTVTFTDSYTLEVGNQVLELEYKGINHEPGNIYIYAPAQKVLMLVDVVFPGWVPFAELALAEDIPGFYAAHDEVLSYDFDVFVGGHLTRTGTREDVEIQQQFVQDLQVNAATALQTVDFNAIAAETGFADQWLLFDTYLSAVAQNCADATLADWVDVLSGAESFTYSHCWAVMESLRID